jgi:heme A synthase
MSPASRSRYATAAWVFLGYTVLVVLWGALVRATLSGDGCGDHWPLCNGEVMPVAPTSKTLIELTHRITSGLAWIGSLVFLVWSRRRFGAGDLVRKGAFWSFFFMTTEALVGAGLVIFRMVADNPDHARGVWTIGHLCNTFLLLAALTLHARWASRPDPIRLRGRHTWLVGAGLLSILAVGATGAIAALGDTLFPVSSLAEGFRQDLDPTSHLFLRLRVLHPLIAIGAAAYLAILGGTFAARGRGRAPAIAVALFALLQVPLGFLNVALLAPVWLQLVHLLVADGLWIALTLLAATLAATASTTDRDRVEVEAGAAELGVEASG